MVCITVDSLRRCRSLRRVRSEYVYFSEPAQRSGRTSARMFPQARIARLDRDTVAAGDFERTLMRSKANSLSLYSMIAKAMTFTALRWSAWSG